MATNGQSRIQDGTAEGLMQFLDYVVSRGYGPASAVSPWRSAARQVLVTVEKTDNIGDVDVLGLDVADYLNRFETLAKGELKVESIDAYKRRFTRALSAYRGWIETGKPPTFRGGTARREKAGPPAEASAPGSTAAAEVAISARSQPGSGGDPMIDYPFPLRNGQVGMLRLPVRFEKADAERLAAFVRTLVLEPQRELGRGDEAGDE